MLREDGTLAATTRFDAPPGHHKETAAERSKDYIRRHWAYSEPARDAGNLLERAQSHSLCISGMAFQDAWNIDLQRLNRCCIHVATPQGKMVPFCSHYLTGSSGQRFAGSRR